MEEVQEQMRKRKSKTQTCQTAGRQAKKGPIVRVIQIFSPVVVHTDEANFCSLVQQLTGLHSAIPMPTSKEPRAPKRTKVSALANPSTDTKPLNTAISDSLSDNVSQLSVLTAPPEEETGAVRTWDVRARANILSDASHSEDFGASTSTELHDVSTAHLAAIPDVSRPRAQLELWSGYGRETLSPSTSDLLQDEALSGVNDDTLLWSALGDETFQTFYDIKFSCGHDDCSDQTTGR